MLTSLSNRFLYKFRWINLPGSLLIVLLQRTPVLRMLVSSEANLVAPSASILRSVLFPAVAFGAIHSRAGATTVAMTPANGTSATTGAKYQAALVATGGGAQTSNSWKVDNKLPPGLTAPEGTVQGNQIVIDFTAAGAFTITGTPTAAGTYSFSAQAWEFGSFTGPTTSATITITVAQGAATAPSITTQPSSQTVTAGANVTFSVAASGSTPLTYQWQKNSAALVGATNTSYTITSAQASDAATYNVVVTNSVNSVKSNDAILTVNPAGGGSGPTITTQPVSQTVLPGGSATFTVAATGATSYQWRKNGNVVTGATNASLVLSNLNASDSGIYSVIATNGSGSTASYGAALVVGSGPGRLSALSVRTFAGTGAQTLTPGFALSSGNGTIPILIRAVGPTLGQPPYNVPSVLADPSLTVYNSSQNIVASNDNWGINNGINVSATLSSVFSQLGDFALPNESLDAALYSNSFQQNSSYTAPVSGANGTTGIVLVELYDASTDPTAPRMNAISARAQVGSGSNALFAGFAIKTAPKTVLIRTWGPELAVAPFNVGGTLADPKLELFDSNNVLIATNDNWGDSPNNSTQLLAVGASAGAYPFVVGSKDSILMVTLPPGTYSVKVSGADGGTGVALAEVYEVSP
ncbi:MAG TPA: immunoglobulin domain-containing protein [Opitutaceae bacterium]|nr:immunoglobulin domain-containing protein [Opitutaceae bacterium]